MLCLTLWKLHAVSDDDSTVNKLLMEHCSLFGGVTKADFSNLRLFLTAGLCFLLGNSPASEFYMPTFRNTLFHLHRQVGKYYLPMKMEQTVFRNVGI